MNQVKSQKEGYLKRKEDSISQNDNLKLKEWDVKGGGVGNKLI